MVEVYITDIRDKFQSDKVITSILNFNPELNINIDFNETGKQYPCGHTVLRVEANKINSEKILRIVRDLGFHCEIMEDKICI